MPPDPTRIADTKAWLTKAAHDLRRVEILLAADPPDVEGAVFHCQQAAEKGFKAFLTWHDVVFRRVHDLDVIGGHCVEVDATLKEIVDRADALTRYAWQFRYPGAQYEPDLEEGQRAATLAHQVTSAVIARLPSEALP